MTEIETRNVKVGEREVIFKNHGDIFSCSYERPDINGRQCHITERNPPFSFSDYISSVSSELAY